LLEASDAAADVGTLLARCSQTRALAAGRLVCWGPLASDTAASVAGQGAKGHASLADQRAWQKRQDGNPQTEHLRWGDTLHIDTKGRDGLSLCGAIEQAVRPVE
jgi:fumarylacetoacetate (FAA) hydrolase